LREDDEICSLGISETDNDDERALQLVLAKWSSLNSKAGSENPNADGCSWNLAQYFGVEAAGPGHNYHNGIFTDKQFLFSPFSLSGALMWELGIPGRLLIIVN
jgi:hypothetical protein